MLEFKTKDPYQAKWTRFKEGDVTARFLDHTIHFKFKHVKCRDRHYVIYVALSKVGGSIIEGEIDLRQPYSNAWLLEQVCERLKAHYLELAEAIGLAGKI